jgi:hypothetical protein
MSTTVRNPAQPLSRCCLEAIELRGPDSPAAGDAVRCEWCDEVAIFRDGRWTGTRDSRRA